MKKFIALMLIFLVTISAGCIFGDDDDNDDGKKSEVQPLETPFLICAGRNPGGVGFDFVSKRKGVAYNMDEVTGLEYDLLVKVIKAEYPDGGVKGAPYADLYGDADGPFGAAMAFEASSLDNIATGDTGYSALTKVTSGIIDELDKDTAGFDLSGAKKGDTGFPLYAGQGNVSAQYKKLVLGDTWKKTAKSEKAGDEQVWVIRTREGKHVKLIFWEFPAKDAPTTTGYVNIKWELID